MREVCVLPLVELLPEVSARVAEMTPGELREALRQGAGYLLEPETVCLDRELRDYVENLVECSALAAQAFRLEQEQRQLESEELELEQRARALAAGRVRDWGERHGSGRTGAQRARAGSDSVPGLVATALLLPASPGDGPEAGGDVSGLLGRLAHEKGWDESATLRNALTCAFALERLRTVDRETLANESKLLSRQCAVLRYRTWVLFQDNRVIRMHLAGLRARVARLQAMVEHTR